MENNNSLPTTFPGTLSDQDFHADPTVGQLAWLDIKNGLLKWPVWLLLAWQDILLRYRRSVLGPFWITLSMSITVCTMGYLYSYLFHIDIHTYFPYLAAGMLVWTLISSLVMDMTETFLASERLMKQIKLPYSLYVHRTAMRNMLIFFHNLLIMIPIFVFFQSGARLTLYSLVFFPAIFLLYINAITYGIIFGMIGARFRDMAQLIRSLVNIVFFMTPVMWVQDVLPKNKQIFVLANPAAAFLGLIRNPMLGKPLAMHDLVYSLIITIVGLLVSHRLFTRYRSRIIFWM